MIGFYNYTVILTYIGTISGILGIINAFNGNILNSIILLMVAGACDMFDGKVARSKKRTKQEERFGIQIDSLSDVICFGVLPAIIGYNIGMNKWYSIIILLYFALGGLIRLAYFNVLEEERQDKTKEVLKFYTGLPITTSAIIFPIIYLICNIFNLNLLIIYSIMMLIVGTLFISKIKIKKIKLKGNIVLILIGVIVLSLLLIFK